MTGQQTLQRDIRKVKAQHREVSSPSQDLRSSSQTLHSPPAAQQPWTTTKWRCVPHSPGSPDISVSLPGSLLSQGPPGFTAHLHTNHSQPGMGRGRGQWGMAPPHQGSADAPPQGQTLLHVSFRNDNPRAGVGGETPPSVLSALKQMTARPQTYPLMGVPSLHGMSGGGGREPSRLKQNEHPGFQRVAVWPSPKGEVTEGVRAGKSEEWLLFSKGRRGPIYSQSLTYLEGEGLHHRLTQPMLHPGSQRESMSPWRGPRD